MIAAALLSLALQTARAIPCGWMDELNDTSIWKRLPLENQPELFAAKTGLLNMRLPRVPDGWPYTYQWSGVTREAIVDLDRYPILVARVWSVQKASYAHLDVEELNNDRKASWVMRSTTLLEPGLSTADVGKDHPGVRRLQIRLIVGAPNEGGSVAYSYVRFVRREDLDFLSKHPDWQRVAWVR